MKLENVHKEILIGSLKSANSKGDFLDLINQCKDLLFNNASPEWLFFDLRHDKSNKKFNDFTMKQLNYYILSSKKATQYKSFSISKKNGGVRTIEAPVKGLKLLQQCINFLLQLGFEPNAAANGFVQNRSVVTNAKRHIGKTYVYNTDLSNFFPSIKFRRVKSVLMLDPINLNDDIAFIVANICCKDGQLPQGAPTSPVISNIICNRLDKKLVRLARKYKSSYTRYADDITFSSMEYCFDKKFEKELNVIIKEEQFSVNTSKVRLQKRGYRQEVTGLIVNEKVNLRKSYVKEIRLWLHIWEKYDYFSALAAFQKNYLKYAKGTSFINVLHGKLEYMKMVKGHEDLLYKKYASQFESLLNSESESKNVDIIEVLKIWETKGIDTAISFYNESKKLN